MNSFFVVWNPNRGLPRYRHSSLEAARLEAERLAKSHPGEDFIVMMSLATCSTKTVIWEDHDK